MEPSSAPESTGNDRETRFDYELKTQILNKGLYQPDLMNLLGKSKFTREGQELDNASHSASNLKRWEDKE